MTFVDKVEALRFEITYPTSLARLIAVQFDEHTIRVKTTARMALDWNQRFSWSDIEEACCVAGGYGSGQILFLGLRGRDEPARVLLDSPGADRLFEQLVQRGVLAAAARRERHPSAQARIGMWCPPPDEPADALRMLKPGPG